MVFARSYAKVSHKGVTSSTSPPSFRGPARNLKHLLAGRSLPILSTLSSFPSPPWQRDINTTGWTEWTHTIPRVAGAPLSNCDITPPSPSFPTTIGNPSPGGGAAHPEPSCKCNSGASKGRAGGGPPPPIRHALSCPLNPLRTVIPMPREESGAGSPKLCHHPFDQSEHVCYISYRSNTNSTYPRRYPTPREAHPAHPRTQRLSPSQRPSRRPAAQAKVAISSSPPGSVPPSLTTTRWKTPWTVLESLLTEQPCPMERNGAARSRGPLGSPSASQINWAAAVSRLRDIVG